MTGLEKITGRILSDAQAEAAEVLAEAETRCRAILAEFDVRADQVRQEIGQKTAAETEGLLTRAQASAKAARQRAQENVRRERLDSVYAQALSKVRAFPPEEYLGLLCRLLTDAVREQLRAEEQARAWWDGTKTPVRYEVLLNARDRAQYAEALMKRFCARADMEGLPKQVVSRVVLGAETVKIDGGVVLRVGRIEIDASLSETFRVLREQTEQKILKTIFP